MEQLEATTLRLRQRRDALAEEQRQMMDSTEAMADVSPTPSAISSPSPPSPSGRDRESAALASLPWRLLLERLVDKPHLHRALTLLLLFAIAVAAALVTTAFVLAPQVQGQGFSPLPPSRSPSPPPRLLLSSLVMLTALYLHLPSSLPPSASLPSRPPLSPDPLLSSPSLLPPRLFTRPFLPTSHGRSHRFHPFIRTGRGSGIDGRALETLRMRTGTLRVQSISQRLEEGGRRRGTDASVTLGPMQFTQRPPLEAVTPQRLMVAMMMLAVVS